MKRILALSPVPEQAAGYRLRIAQYEPFLRLAGFHLDIHALFDDKLFQLAYKPGRYAQKAARLAARTLDRLRVVRTARAYDAILLYREAYPIGPPVLERMLARTGRPIVYDFDDAVYLPNTSDANRLISFLKNPAKVPELLRLSAHTMAGNRHIAEYARSHGARVTVIPTSIDTEVWLPRPAGQSNAVPVIGWIGSPTTVPYLLALSDPLSTLARSHRFVLKVSGSPEPIRIPGVHVEWIPWTLEREVELFSTCDVGIYPMPDDPWSRGKSGLKALQFMACEVPVVAAAVGTNREIIAHDVNGLLAGCAGDWPEHLSRLLEDSSTRKRLGEAGRKTVLREYALARLGPRVASIFTELTE